jgi:uncharacterized membrane protein YfcA
VPLPAFDSTTLYVVLVVFAATLVRSTLGFGEALIAVPLLALRIPVAIAAPLAVLMSVVVAGVIVILDWRRIDFRSAGSLVAASFFGIPLGVLLLAKTSDHLVKVGLGTVIIGFSIYSLVPGRRRPRLNDHVGWLVVCGTCQACCAGEFTDPCSGKKREGLCRGDSGCSDCFCPDCGDCDCCCDGCDCDCGC